MRNAKPEPSDAESKRPNVLLVDDDPHVVGMLRVVLEHHGYHCLAAYGGAQALSRFAQSDDIDVIVTDLSMRWGDGVSFIQAVRRHNDVPIFVITGRIGEFAARVSALENVFVLPKPVETQELIKRIKQTCHHRKSAPAHDRN